MAPNMIKPLKRKYLPTSSSSSDEFNAASMAMTIEEFMLGKDEWRVGPDNIRPVPYPHTISSICSERTREGFQKCESKIEEILKKFNINYTILKLCRMWPKGEPEEARDTLIVQTDDESEDKKHWQAACGEIFLMLLDQGRLDQSELQVEMTNPTRTLKDISSCLPNDATLLAAIQSVGDKLFNAVMAHLPNQVSSIAWHMRGPRGAPEVVLKPTAMIYVRKRSFLRFLFAEEKLEEALLLDADAFPGVRLSLEIVRGDIVLDGDQSPPNSARKNLTDLTLQPLNGASIGCGSGNTIEGAGTLGGWVMFEDRNGTKHKCFLTCYHVIQDGDIAGRAWNDEEGIALNGHPYRKRIEVTYPAICDATKTQEHLTRVVSNAQGTTKQYSERQLELVKELKGRDIGFVLHASGHRRISFDRNENVNNRRRLDWALIESPTTFTKNKPPPSALISQWPDGRKPTSGLYFTAPSETTTEIAEPKSWEWLIKLGRSSLTSGLINIVPRIIIWDHQSPSHEMEILGLNDEFAWPGDSGAWVFNEQKRVVGLLFARSDDETTGCMTPISVVFDDIEKQTGGKVYLS